MFRRTVEKLFSSEINEQLKLNYFIQCDDYLRDPVKRAISNYTQTVSKKPEMKTSSSWSSSKPHQSPSARFSVCIACLNADGREEISKEKISQGFRSGDCTGQWGGANFPFQHCGKILVQINNIYASCMAGDLVLDVKDLRQMPHPSSPKKYLLS
ncbi:hypothetical protein Zmor_018209 [Zophobas morio]|uniref:Uncharacterized protein n=1 Tax=Zophobas morio TaxID=2755281 RepID=A0AA38IDU9_9CUCU|nr:hypothetical protein Zmor_018209 [Zophobas morio]